MTCPFCGVEADAPHETQKACIQALNAEIVRVRAILEHLRPPARGRTDESDGAPPPPASSRS